MGSYREQRPTDRFEKRKLPRFPVQLPVEIGHQRDDLASICTNLSRQGVSVETSTLLSVGERLAVCVTLAPKEEPLRMVGQVVWCREMGAVDTADQKVREIGIRFLRPLPIAQRFVRDEEEEEFDATPEYTTTDLPDVPPSGTL